MIACTKGSFVARGGANTNGVQNGPGIPNGPGTVFRLSPPTSQQTQWSERVPWSFGASDDDVRPRASLLADNWCWIYGTTIGGGPNSCSNLYGCGTVFELSLP
jgi:hypothetical protein